MLNNKNCAITVGSFDSLHIAHQELIKMLSRFQNSCVITFDIPPKSYLSGEHFIFTLNERIKFLENFTKLLSKRLNINKPKLLVFEFPKIKNLTVDLFLEKLHRICNFSIIVVGYDSNFGKRKTPRTFKHKHISFPIQVWANIKNISIIQVPPLALSDFPNLKGDSSSLISTSFIKKLISSNKLDEVRELLGRPYSISYKVIKGKGIGRKMGFATANGTLEAFRFLPKEGVYLTSTLIEGEPFNSLTFIGDSYPYTENSTLETHILNFNRDIYGKNITVLFHKFIRPSKQFTSLKELKRFLESDKTVAQKLLKDVRPLSQQELAFFL